MELCQGEMLARGFKPVREYRISREQILKKLEKNYKLKLMFFASRRLQKSTFSVPGTTFSVSENEVDFCINFCSKKSPK